MKGKRKQQRMKQELLEEEKKLAEETKQETPAEEEKPKEIWEKFKKEEPKKKKPKGLTGFNIKIIACLSMLFDHIAAIFIDEGYLILHPNIEEAPDWMAHLDFAMRAFGRLAFPLFCFLMIEGYFHTRNKLKYLRNLIIFGVISEVPFDMAFNRSFCDWSGQNVFFTLALGLLTVWGIDFFTKGSFMKADPKSKLGAIFVVTVACIAAFFIHCDYIWLGILVVLFMYIYRKSHGISAAGLVFLFVLYNPLELFSMIDFAILPLYNGERRHNLKYAFYVFYPAHILILAIIRKITMGI